MADLKILSIWAARLGLVVSIIAQINGNFGPVDNTYAAVIITSLIFAATFAPEPYYATTRHYVREAGKAVSTGLFLVFVTYTTATTAVLINGRALPGLATLIRASPLETARLIFLIVVFAIAPYVQAQFEAFRSKRTHRPDAEAKVDKTDPPTEEPTEEEPPEDEPTEEAPPEGEPPADEPPTNGRPAKRRTRKA